MNKPPNWPWVAVDVTVYDYNIVQRPGIEDSKGDVVATFEHEQVRDVAFAAIMEAYGK